MTFKSDYQWGLLTLAGLVTLVGCGGTAVEHEPTFPVTGTITQKGAPLAGAVVTFQPTQGGKAAMGATDAAGHYALTTWAKDDGATAGRFRVTVTKYEGQDAEEAIATTTETTEVDFTDPNVDEYPDDYDELTAGEAASAVKKNILPKKYADPGTSGLEAEVVEGENPPIDFTLDG